MPKKRVKKIIMHRRPSPSRIEEKINNLTKELGEVKELVKKVAVKSAVEIGRLTAQLSVNIKSIDELDTNVLVTALVLKEVFGQLQQIDDMLKLLDPEVSTVSAAEGKTLDQRVDEQSIVERARAWYSDVVNNSFQRVRAEKEEHERKQKQAAEDAAKAKVETQEKIRMENELRKDVERDIIKSETSEQPETTFPEGAQIFGG